MSSAGRTDPPTPTVPRSDPSAIPPHRLGGVHQVMHGDSLPSSWSDKSPIASLQVSKDDMHHVVYLQSLVRTVLAQEELARRRKNLKIRTLAALEIYDTEKAYVNSLKLMTALWLNPLKIAIGTDNEIITQRDIEALFPNGEVIINLGAQLLELLSDRMDNWDPYQKIGDVFLKLGAFFKMYVTYVGEYESAVQTMRRLQTENSRFAQFINHTTSMKEINDGLDLPSFLIKPVQRIPRYILLLDALFKRTDPEHPDYNDLRSAIELIQNVADHVNEGMKEAQRMAALLEIEQKFGYTLKLMKPTRKLVKEGSLGKITSTIVVYPQYFLFSDVMIYAYEISGGYTLKGTIEMGTTWLRDLPDTDTVKNAWQIIARKKTWIVFAETPKEKQAWFVALSTLGMKEMNAVIERLVAMNPSLISKRSKKVTLTDRGLLKSFWNIFSPDSSVGHDNAADVERDFEEKAKADAALARERSTTLMNLREASRKRSHNNLIVPNAIIAPVPSSTIIIDDEDISRPSTIEEEFKFPKSKPPPPNVPALKKHQMINNTDARMPLLTAESPRRPRFTSVAEEDSDDEGDGRQPMCESCTIL